VIARNDHDLIRGGKDVSESPQELVQLGEPIRPIALRDVAADDHRVENPLFGTQGSGERFQSVGKVTFVGCSRLLADSHLIVDVELPDHRATEVKVGKMEDQ
jgi:hypothetical protein